MRYVRRICILMQHNWRYIHQWWPYIARKAVNNIRILMLRSKAPFSRSKGLSNDRIHFLERARVPFTHPIGTLYQMNF